MNALDTYLAAMAPGMDIVLGCAGMSEDDLCARGAAEKTARELALLKEAYCGTTKFTGKRRRAIEGAQHNGHSIVALSIIEKYARKMPTLFDAWVLREQLCTTKATAGALEKLAQSKVPKKKRTVKPGVRIIRRKDAPWTLAIDGSSSFIADLHAAVENQNKKPLDVVEDTFFGDDSAQRSTVVTNVIVRLEDYVRIVNGDGEEITLQMTNGATLSGAQYLRRTLKEHGLITLVSPYEGAVNLYRTERFANAKQRLMAGAENPVCPWPRCAKPADECQIHHLDPWLQGGLTNIANLSTACAYHNGANDDDPNAPPLRGRLSRTNGQIRWQPP
ncbi:HNH endonuclease [Corynebacterium kefirresidentii]|nr:HNH endonuclease signature motif containing protein [Corynebacterium kefirresidentii]MCG7449204.1 HNH endonuclease [Corynebacterium kefirresidentii]MCG7451272.1 HNH endonuclease [Corynebacterium kefirresidentii]